MLLVVLVVGLRVVHAVVDAAAFLRWPAAWAMSSEAVSMFWHSQPSGASKTLSITYRCQKRMISWASASGWALRVMPTLRHISARRELRTSAVSSRLRSDCGISYLIAGCLRRRHIRRRPARPRPGRRSCRTPGLQQRVAAEPVGAVQAGRGDLAAGVEIPDVRPGRGVRLDAADHVVGARPDGDQVVTDVDVEALAQLADQRESLGEVLLVDMPHVEVDVGRVGLAHLLEDRPADHVARGQLAGLVYSFMNRRPLVSSR